jgi:hypothetical protein
MNVLSTTWHQLVRRRLWPVAVLLVAALAAIPVLLSRDPEPVPASAAPPADSTVKVSDSLEKPVIDAATPEQRSRRRRVLGIRKDPFTPYAVKHPKKVKKLKAATTPKVAVVKPPTTPKPSSSSPSTSPSVSPPSTPGVTAPSTPAKPKPKQYAKGSLIVRFGDATTDALPRFNVPKLAALPQGGTADADPLLVYMGLTKDRKKAIFLVDASLDPTGDGDCKPHPSSCETIQLAKGETEFFDLVDDETGDVTAQYELDLVDIK